MKISFCNSNLRLNNNKLKQNNIKFKQLSMDTVSFSALKKSNFEGFDLFAINKFKAPIEKFNSNDDFQNWCKDKIENEYVLKVDKLCESDDRQAENQKKDILNNWIEYVCAENTALNPALQLLILSSITSNLDSKTNHLPPNLDKRIVADTLAKASENFKNNKNYSFNFDKLYRSELITKSISDNKEIDENCTGWIMIPSLEHDRDNFKQNVIKLQTLSHDSWCTKTYNAQPYLSKGDFYIYMDNGYPKLGVRFCNGLIEEVQGEKNNGLIPLKYLDTLTEKFDVDAFSEYVIDQIVVADETRLRIRRLFPKGIENYTTDEILTKFGIEVEKDENGMSIIDYFEQPEGITYDEIGINENKLLKNVIEIKGNANFENSNITSLKNLKKIDGNAMFGGCKDIDLRNLEHIAGKAYFDYSKISKLPKLGYIGDSAYFEYSKIEDLGSLRYIGKNGFFNGVNLLTPFSELSVGNELRVDKAGLLSNVVKVEGEHVYVKDKEYDSKIIEYIQKIKKAINRKFVFREVINIMNNELNEKQIKAYNEYVTKEGMDFEEAAYEASFYF